MKKLSSKKNAAASNIKEKLKKDEKKERQESEKRERKKQKKIEEKLRGVLLPGAINQAPRNQRRDK